jgi:hypothetical protein
MKINMKKLLGALGIIVGIILGVYVGVWVCLVGGIIGLITSLVALFSGKILVGLIGWSIVKIIFAGLFGWISGMVIVVPSYKLATSGK